MSIIRFLCKKNITKEIELMQLFNYYEDYEQANSFILRHSLIHVCNVLNAVTDLKTIGADTYLINGRKIYMVVISSKRTRFTFSDCVEYVIYRTYNKQVSYWSTMSNIFESNLNHASKFFWEEAITLTNKLSDVSIGHVGNILPVPLYSVKPIKLPKKSDELWFYVLLMGAVGAISAAITCYFCTM